MKKSFLIALLISFAVSAFAEEHEGKVWVKSEPPGATIWLAVKDAAGTLTPKDTSKKTNALVVLPEGKQTVILHLDGYEDATVEVSVNPAGIAKPDTIVMSKQTKPIDILFAEDGWTVSIDGKPASDTVGKPATTPCTIKMAVGKHEIALAKDGFKDIPFKCEVVEKTTNIEVKGNVEKGKRDTQGNKEAAKDTKDNRQKKSATIHACVDDDFDLYINEQRIMSGGCNQNKSKDVEIAMGDIIIVRAINTGGPRGFACVLKFKDIKFAIVTNNHTWQSYTPKSEVDWFLLAGINKPGKTQPGSNQSIKNGVIENSGVDCDSIWGFPETCYLMCKITNDVFTPIK